MASKAKIIPPADSNKLATDILAAIMGVVSTTNADAILEQVMPKVEASILERYGCLPEVHEIRRVDLPATTVQGSVHEKFDEVLNIVNMDIPVYLTGKAGTGKNVICQQVATALGLDFYFTNAVTQEYKLTGFIDANGHYQETQFYKAFTNGGLFFLDEMDASIPETLIILNAAIANRYFDFPTGKVDAHPNFRVIAAGNTNGTGADNNYTGRYCLDRASLDRFAKVHIDYSPKIEKSMARNNMPLIDFCHTFRSITEKAGIECLFSYRSLDRIAKLETVFNDLAEVLSVSLLSGLDGDTIAILQNEFKKRDNMRNNKYAKALMGTAKWDFQEQETEIMEEKEETQGLPFGTLWGFDWTKNLPSLPDFKGTAWQYRPFTMEQVKCNFPPG